MVKSISLPFGPKPVGDKYADFLTLSTIRLGSAKSGFYGHKGRPGKRGGSAARGSGGFGAVVERARAAIEESGDPNAYVQVMLDAIRKGEMTFDQAVEFEKTIKGPKVEKKERPEKDVITPEIAVRDLNLPEGTIERNEALTKIEHKWLSAVDVEAKEDITQTYEIFPELKELRLYQMYGIAGKEGQSFEQFKDSEVTVWRGGSPVYAQTFSTFTLSKSTAEMFTDQHGGDLYELKIKPSDLAGFAPTGATEAFVPGELESTGNAPRTTTLGEVVEPTCLLSEHSGAMVALHIPEPVGKKLALDDGLSPKDMHVTLVYMGEADEQDQTNVESSLSEFSATHPPFTGRVGGIGRFAASKTSDGKDVIYASVDAGDLPAFRQALVEALNVEPGDHGFTPHITLKYISPTDPMPIDSIEPLALMFDKIYLHWGDGVKEYTLDEGKR